MCVCVCMCVCVHACVCICVCVNRGGGREGEVMWSVIWLNLSYDRE